MSFENLERTKSAIKKGYSDFDSKTLKATQIIVEDVRKNGNKALYAYTKKFDRFDINSSNLTVKKKGIDNQVTNLDSGPLGQTLHIQIFNVGNLCSENNFFDFYTPNDTHVYNLRDITRNDGTPQYSFITR